jgi:hypothetical protein
MMCVVGESPHVAHQFIGIPKVRPHKIIVIPVTLSVKRPNLQYISNAVTLSCVDDFVETKTKMCVLYRIAFFSWTLHNISTSLPSDSEKSYQSHAKVLNLA